MTSNRLILVRLASLLAIVLAVSASCFAGTTHKLIQVDGKKIVAVMSPDGSKAVWVGNLGGEVEDGHGDYDIYVSKPEKLDMRDGHSLPVISLAPPSCFG